MLGTVLSVLVQTIAMGCCRTVISSEEEGHRRGEATTPSQRDNTQSGLLVMYLSRFSMQLHGLGLKRTSHEARVWKDKSALTLLAACVRQHDMSRRGNALTGMEPMLEKPLLEMAERLIDEGGYLRRAGSARSVGRQAFVGLLVYLARCRIKLQGNKCGVGLIFALVGL